MAERAPVRLGFRARVIGFTAGLLATAIAVGLLVQRAVLLERLDREVAASLEQEASEMRSLADGRDPETGQPFAGDVRAIFDTFLRRNVPVEGEVYLTIVDGRPYNTSRAPVRLDRQASLVERWASSVDGERGSLSTEAGPVRYLVVPLRQDGRTRGTFVVANFIRDERDEVEDGIRVSAAVAAVVLAITTVVGWLVAGRLLRPVRQLTDSARTISETDLRERIPVEGNDEIAELARTYNEMLDRLAAAFDTQRAFIDDAGHELRTPITIIRGHLELMGDDPEERRSTLELVTDELDRMSRMVDDLLVLAKSDQPDFVRRQPVELSDLTSDLLAKMRGLGQRSWRLDDCGEGVLHADPQRLTQAVLNLARNAYEHTRPGDEIGLGSAWRADEVHLWVRDTGPGVHPADRSRIFERFTRGHGGRRRSDGAGLGLAIVGAIAVAHGGHVGLDDGDRGGATFRLVLPGVALKDPRPLPESERTPPWPAS